MALTTYGSQLSATTSFLLFLRTLIVIYRPDIIDEDDRVQPTPLSEIQESYDFVIIGSGSAGSVLANRLSENGNWSILMIEAGVNEPYMTDVPIISHIFWGTPIDWQFQTYPSNNYCLGMNEHRCNWPRARVLGGGSVLSDMAYVRGNRKNYDGWENLGNLGWNYESVLPYFLKSEDMRIPEYQNSPYHHKGGLLTVERFRHRSYVVEYLLRAGTEMGYDIVDVNGATQTGFNFYTGTLRNGLRCSTAKAFLRPVWRRRNLDIIVQSLAEKILLRQDGNRITAYGVQFRSESQSYTVKANREVILSAGAVQSPVLLMLSGIGPREHLEKFNITVLHDAPGVGKNLQDHVILTGMSFVVTKPANYPNSESFDYNSNNTISVDELKQFAINHTGSLYTIPFEEGVGFINTKYVNRSEDYPDIQLVITSIFNNTNTVDSLLGSVNLMPTFEASLNENILNLDTYSTVPICIRPRSRGYIKLNSTEPDQHPIIVPNYLSDPHDVDVLAEGAQFAYSMSKTPTMRWLKAELNPTKILECSSFEYPSADYWRCAAPYLIAPGDHVCGTCKMGPANDKMAVVDARLRVHGIFGLRVVDASIMPTITSGNINAPVIMIAEKASDMIKQDWEN